MLAAAQAKVDNAYTATGRPKLGKKSPFCEIRNRLQVAMAEQENARKLAEESRSAEKALEEVTASLAQARTHHAEATAESESLQEAWRNKEACIDAAKLLADAQRNRDRVRALHRAVEETGTELETARVAFSDAKSAVKTAESELTAVEDQASLAAKRVEELESGSAEQKRKIRQQKIEKKLLALDVAEKDAERDLERAKEAADLHRKAEELARNVAERDEQLQDVRARLLQAEERALKDQAALADLDQLYFAGALATSLTELGTARETAKSVAMLRKDAAEKRKEAQVIRSRVTARSLPDDKALSKLSEQRRALEIAEGKLQVGLSVRITPEKPLGVSVTADSTPPDDRSLESEEFFEADARLRVDLVGIAQVEVTGGNPTLRQEAQNLRLGWDQEVLPLLEATGVNSFEQLVDAFERATEDLAEAKVLEMEAEKADSQARGAGDAKSRLEIAERSAQDAREQLVARLPAGRSIEHLLEEVGSTGDPEAIKRKRETLEQDIAKRRDLTPALRTQVARDESGHESAKRELEAQLRDYEAAEGRLDGEHQHVHEKAQRTLDKITLDRSSLEIELEELVAGASATIDAAREQRTAAGKRVDQARKLLDEKKAVLAQSEAAVTRLAAQLEERQARAAEEDMKATELLVVEKEKEVEKLPRPDLALDEQALEAVRRHVKRAGNEARDLESEQSRREGALETVGGQYIQDKLDRAQESVESISELEHELEIVYSSWKLLLETLHTAESEDAEHLGDAIVGPIVERVAVLMQGRYDNVSIGPRLDGAKLTLGGTEVDQHSLSIGTRGQLATLLRLTIAEVLETVVVLDDQLVHSDVGRMNRLAELIYRCAKNSQVLVFTCRPEEYELENYTATANWVDLEKLVERTDDASTTSGHPPGGSLR